MVNSDLYSIVSHPIVALSQQLIKTNVETVGKIVDIQGASSILVVFQSGVITDGTFTPVIYGGLKPDMSDAKILDDFPLGKIKDVTFDNKMSDTARKIGIVDSGNQISSYRYYRVNIVSTNCTAGGTIGASMILGGQVDSRLNH